jgi:hypothetical protein
MWWAFVLFGGFCLIVLFAMAAAHYLFGMQLHNGNTNQLAPEHSVAQGFLVVGGIAALFTIVGAVALSTYKD